MNQSKEVTEYIKRSPASMRPMLKQLRAIIQKVAPRAEERISYGMPFYDCKGRLVYFAPMKNYIGIYIPPPIIAQHAQELASYTATKSAIHIPLGKIPAGLIQKLIKARMKHNELKSNK